MQPSVILWSHALAALLFGALALGQFHQHRAGLPRGALVTALAATALWALAVAGIGSGDVATRIAEGARNLAWLAFLFALSRGNVPLRNRRWLACVYVACALVTALTMVQAVAEASATLDGPQGAAMAERIAATRQMLGMLGST
ncbi:MAG: PEP-CTERM system histidine kinase PrsK, partial [Sphingomonas bacterium]